MSNTDSRFSTGFEVFRIGSPSHRLLDGAGAAAADDARWNTKGRFVIYTAEHYATALLEKAAQLNTIRIPRSLVFVRIRIPANASVEEVGSDDLPGWDADEKMVSQRYGDRWYDESRSLILLVPSMAAPGIERNLLINQRHSEFEQVTVSTPERVRCHPKLLT